MSQQGWVKLHRILQEHWLWKDKPFSKGQAWIDMVMMANHDDNKFLLGNELVEVSRGSFITSELKLMERWGWSKTKIRSFLNLLQNDSMIVKKTDHKKTTITIVKYSDYQDKETAEEPQKNRRETAERPRKDTNKNDKNDKNEKKISGETSSQKFIPPSLEEVQAYCRERNNNVDAQRWYDFYLSKNWMIGKNKMKDWKAAVRTWEKNNKDKPSTPSPKSFNNFKNREYDTDELKKRLLAKSRGGQK